MELVRGTVIVPLVQLWDNVATSIYGVWRLSTIVTCWVVCRFKFVGVGLARSCATNSQAVASRRVAMTTQSAGHENDLVWAPFVL